MADSRQSEQWQPINFKNVVFQPIALKLLRLFIMEAKAIGFNGQQWLFADTVNNQKVNMR